MPITSESTKHDGKAAEANQSDSSSSSSSESLASTDASSLSMPAPPDGGYGWTIILSAFFINMISDGISFSFGILYTELLDYFGESKSMTSWVGSLFYGTCLMGGPLASALATKFGCRKVTVFGGLLATAGCLMTSISGSIGMLCFWFGIVTGIGMSMGYVTSVVMVAFYFEKKRALATGLSVCGSGIGTFLFAPLTEYLLMLYGWRGTMMIWSGIMLNLVVCGALLRPLEFTPHEQRIRALRKFEMMSKTVSCTSVSFSCKSQSRHVSHSDGLDSDSATGEEDELEHCHSQIQIPTFLTDNKVHIPLELLKEAKHNNAPLKDYIKNIYLEGDLLLDSQSVKNNDGDIAKKRKIQINGDIEVLSRETSTSSLEKEMLMDVGKDKPSCLKKSKTDVQMRKDSDGIWKPKVKINKQVALNTYLPLYRKDIFFRGNLMRLYNPTGQIKSTSCPELYKSSWESDSESSDDEDDWECWRCIRMSKHVKKVLKTMFDPSILAHPLYVIFAISNFILYFWYDVPYIFMADRALEYGMSDKATSFLISILGIVNTFGQVLYGFIGDKSVNLSLLYGLSLMVCGVSVLLVPLFTTFLPLAILSGTFGLFISVNYALSTVILVEFLGIDKLSNAYGLTMLVQGIANLVGPPLAGFLYDFTGSYDATFFTGGGFIVLSGLLLLLVPLVQSLHLTFSGPWPPDKSCTSLDDKSYTMADRDDRDMDIQGTTCSTKLVAEQESGF